MPNTLVLPKTNDAVIRKALRKSLRKDYEKKKDTKIIEELGLKHGSARIDIAVVNGVIHGYELKSDLDTLMRLPEQMKVYNSTLDRVTLVVSKNHLHEAIRLVPEWWGIIIARSIDLSGNIKFFEIRDAEENPSRDTFSITKLLWREEALNILEEFGYAGGLRSKSRSEIYYKLTTVLNQDELRSRVRTCLRTRVGWRSVKQYKLCGD